MKIRCTLAFLVIMFHLPSFGEADPILSDLMNQIEIRKLELDGLENLLTHFNEELTYWQTRREEKRDRWAVGAGIVGGLGTAAYFKTKWLIKKLRAKPAPQVARQALCLGEAADSLVKPIIDGALKHFGLKKMLVIGAMAGLFLVGTDLYHEWDGSEEENLFYIQKMGEFSPTDRIFIEQALQVTAWRLELDQPEGASLLQYGPVELENLENELSQTIDALQQSSLPKNLNRAEALEALHFARHFALLRRIHLLELQFSELIQQAKDISSR